MRNDLTTPYFWDCNCETGYIHHKTYVSCPECGVDWLADEAPDSRTVEVLELFGNAIPAKTGLLPKSLPYGEDLKLYPLPFAYRVPSYYKHDHGTTAADVLRHEIGNGAELLTIPASLWELLERCRADEVTWVCAGEEWARRYGDDVQKIEFEDRIVFALAGDGDYGLLVFTPFQKIHC